MARVLRDLAPERVFYYFEEMTKIPRCSGEEQNVSDYLVDFAKTNNLQVIQDGALNIIIKKPGTKGYENAETVVLQGHMDMVCEKEADVDHDFSKDPIKLQIEGDYIKGTGTTIGADNGIAIAMCLAILESKEIDHPPLEILATTSEETGMDGAIALDPNHINGRILINIDSEEEGKLLVSCAGGERDKIEIPILWEDIDEGKVVYSVEITGLKGGHSGMEIDKGRGNTNKLMGRLLYEFRERLKIQLGKIEGGAKTNAIPRSGEFLILIDEKDEKAFKNLVKEMEEEFKNELKIVDENIKIEIDKKEMDIDKVFSDETSEKVIATLMLMPNGIQSVSMEVEGLVESSNNLGIVKTLENTIAFESSIRSSVRSLRENIGKQMAVISKILGGSCERYASYPEWEYEEDSYIRKVAQGVYKDKFGEEIEIAAIHAGLECGLFKEKFKEMDMISFGPDMYEVHTPEEKLSISSTKNIWKLLLGILKEIK